MSSRQIIKEWLNSDLAKEYSAKGMMEEKHYELNLSQQQAKGTKQEINIHHDGHRQDQVQAGNIGQKPEMINALELLLKPERY